MKINQEDLLKKLSDHIPGMVYQFRMYPDGRFCMPYASEGVRDLFGIEPHELVEDATLLFSRIAPEYMDALMQSIQVSAETLQDWKFECFINHPTKGTRWLHGASRPELIDDGSIVWYGSIHDLTDRKKTEEELLHKNILLAMSEKINGMIVHSKSHDDIFSAVCEILTLRGGFRLAWIGLYDSAIDYIVPVSISGTDEGYLKQIGPISAKGSGPSATAFREGRSVINNDTQNNPNMTVWRQLALARGYHSSIALPLIIRNRPVGTLNIYSSEVGHFTPDEVTVLENVTRNMSFAIEILEDRKTLTKSEHNFRTIFERAPMGILLVDSATAEIYQANDRFLEILGYKRETFEHTTWIEFTHPEDLSTHLKNRELLAERKISSFRSTKRYLKADNTYTWVEALVVPYGPGDDFRPKNLIMVQDISERMKYQDHLQKSIQIKDEFFAIASHELKTPTTSLKLQLQLLQRYLDPERYAEIDRGKVSQGLDRTLVQVDRLVGLVSNLLDVVNFRNGQLRISPADTDLSELLKDVIGRYEPLFKEKGCEINPEIEPGLTGSFDKHRIEQVFLNLMDNAAKYAPGKPIDIALKKEGEFPVFIIKDHGPGIENSKLEKIFDRFERLGADRNVSGMGLGLYITKNIVDAHDGRISVSSSPGKGTSFKVSLRRPVIDS